MERFNSYDDYEKYLNNKPSSNYERLMYTLFPNRDPRNQPVTFDVLYSDQPYQNKQNKAKSTVVRRIRYFPMSKTALVSLGNVNIFYPYFMNDLQLSQWMRSNSLGRFYNNYIKRK